MLKTLQQRKLTTPSGPLSRDQTWSWQTFWVVVVLLRHFHPSADVPNLRLLVTVPLQVFVSIIQLLLESLPGFELTRYAW